MKIKPWRNGAGYGKQAGRLGWLQAAVINIDPIHMNPFGAGECPQFLLMLSKHAAGEGNHSTVTHCSVPGAGNFVSDAGHILSSGQGPQAGAVP